MEILTLTRLFIDRLSIKGYLSEPLVMRHVVDGLLGRATQLACPTLKGVCRPRLAAVASERVNREKPARFD